MPRADTDPARAGLPGAALAAELGERIGRLIRLSSAWARRAGRRPGTRPASFRSHLTARGALLGIFLFFLIGCLVAAWGDHDVLAGLAYCAGAALAPVYARRGAQLAVVLSAPAVFLLAVVITQALTGQGSSGHAWALSVLEGTALTLAAVAPWLFAGTAVCTGIALTRGLPECIRRLRESPGGTTGMRPAPGGAATAADSSTRTRPRPPRPLRSPD